MEPQLAFGEHPAVGEGVDAASAAEVANVGRVGEERVPAGDPDGGLFGLTGERGEGLGPDQPPVLELFAFGFVAHVAVKLFAECHFDRTPGVD